MNRFGKKLKEYRESEGMTVKEVAEALTHDPSRVEFFERRIRDSEEGRMHGLDERQAIRVTHILNLNKYAAACLLAKHMADRYDYPRSSDFREVAKRLRPHLRDVEGLEFTPLVERPIADADEEQHRHAMAWLSPSGESVAFSKNNGQRGFDRTHGVQVGADPKHGDMQEDIDVGDYTPLDFYGWTTALVRTFSEKTETRKIDTADLELGDMFLARTRKGHLCYAVKCGSSMCGDAGQHGPRPTGGSDWRYWKETGVSLVTNRDELIFGDAQEIDRD